MFLRRDQLSARLALVRRITVRAQLHVLRGILVTDFSNDELQSQLRAFREAVHGKNACFTRAQYEDRLAAALLKESEGRYGNGYDHGQRFMSVDEEVDEMTDGELRDELKRRGVRPIPRKKLDKYEKLCELLEAEHEDELEHSIECVLVAELEKRFLPTNERGVTAWVKRNRDRIAAAAAAKNNKKRKKSEPTLEDAGEDGEEEEEEEAGGEEEAGQLRGQKRGRGKASRSVEANRGTPRKKRQRVAVVSSPSASADSSSGGGSGEGDNTSRTILKEDPLNVPILVQRPNWKEVTIRQMMIEMLLPQFDNEPLHFAGEEREGDNGSQPGWTCVVM